MMKTNKEISFPFMGLKGPVLKATTEEMDDFYKRGGKITYYKPEKDKMVYIRTKESQKGMGAIDKSKYLPIIEGEETPKT